MSEPTEQGASLDDIPREEIVTVNPRIEQAAAEERERWKRKLGGSTLTAGGVACRLLGISRETLLEKAFQGEIDVTVIDGSLMVPSAQVRLWSARRVAESYWITQDLQAQVRVALVGYLKDFPVTASWDEANHPGGLSGPLVCARRGKSRTHYGIEYHSVVFKAATLALYARVQEHYQPELAGFPVGPALVDALVKVPGIEPVRYAKPLISDGKNHKLYGWVRVDPSAWKLNVPDDVAELVGPPPGLR